MMFMKASDHHKTRKWIKVAKISFLVLIVLFVILSLVYGDKSLASVTGGADATAFEDFIMNFYKSLSGLVGLLAVTMIIAGGIVYATSEGNPDKIKTAKEIIIAAIMGALLFAFANWLLGSNGISKYFPVPLEKLQGNNTTREELPPPPGSGPGGENGSSGGGGGGGGGGGW